MKPRGVLALLVLLALGFVLTAGNLLAQQAAPAAQKPVASIDIVPVPANPASPNVIEALLSDGKTKVQMGTTGLNNVSVQVPVTLKRTSVSPRPAPSATTLGPPPRTPRRRASLTTAPRPR